MTEVLLEAPKVTVGFLRKVNLGNYESAEASIFIQVPTTPNATSEEITAASKLSFADAKATVFEQLGIVFDVVENVVVEKLGRALGAVEVTGNEVPTHPSPAPNVKAPGAVPTTTDEKWADIVANPKGWLDNRTTKTGKQPDFKRKGAPANGEKFPPSLWADKVPDGVVVPDPSQF